MIGGGLRVAGAEAHVGIDIAADGAARLSHPTSAFTRGSRCPTNDTPAAPNE